MKRFPLTLVLLATMPLSAWAGHESKGGDSRALAEYELKTLIEGQLKTEVSRLAQNLVDRAPYIEDLELRSTYTQMIQAGLVDDIARSSLSIETQCVDDQGVSRAATARINDLGGKICFDVKQLAAQLTTFDHLVGLTMHEFAHHFGIADADHSLAAHAAKFFNLLRANSWQTVSLYVNDDLTRASVGNEKSVPLHLGIEKFKWVKTGEHRLHGDQREILRVLYRKAWIDIGERWIGSGANTLVDVVNGKKIARHSTTFYGDKATLRKMRADSNQKDLFIEITDEVLRPLYVEISLDGTDDPIEDNIVTVQDAAMVRKLRAWVAMGLSADNNIFNALGIHPENWDWAYSVRITVYELDLPLSATSKETEEAVETESYETLIDQHDILLPKKP